MNQKQLELQRDLYKLLLNTGEENMSIDTCFSKALRLVVEITGARIGYIELRNPQGQSWWSNYQCTEDDISVIRGQISSGIIAESLESDETIVTPSAFLDPRFSTRESVQAAKIEAVLCSPISDGETKGVVYLQGDSGAQLGSTHCMMETGLFTRHLTPLLRRLKYQVTASSHKEKLREKYVLKDLIGESKVLYKMLKEAMAIAEIDVTVLLTGETGTGKSVLAKAIHMNSSRACQPFVHLNCANIPENLMESELFGAVRGSHSNAFQDMKGKIAAADKGTLFLDEIGELPLMIQTKLLQFLEDGYYYQLGSQVMNKADVRIITASNTDFIKAIKIGKFRQDLYYRICVFPVESPPLRRRSDDIADLIYYFIAKYCKKYSLPSFSIAPTTIQILKEGIWSGNIRELQNVLIQGLVRAKTEGVTIVEMRHFLPVIKKNDMPQSQTITYRQGKDSWEKQFIESRLIKYRWNVSETARSLDLSRSHINNLIKAHSLERNLDSSDCF